MVSNINALESADDFLHFFFLVLIDSTNELLSALIIGLDECIPFV